MTKFVLVPGAWLGGWVWRKVTPLLEDRGNEVYAVTLTGMGERVHLASREVGIETAIRDVLNVLEYNDLDDVVLVGHSFAGKVVAAAADRAPERVRTVLYLDAYRPEKVRTPQGSFDPNEFVKLDPSEWRVAFTEGMLDNIGKDVRGADRQWMLSKATPWPRRLVTEPVTLSERFDSLRSAYVLCTGGGDDVEAVLKEKLDGPVRVIDSGHWPMITKPEETADDLLSLAREAVP
ncbi:MAG: alpha/beta hydrolase [Nitrososphaerales archaeon]